MPLTPSIWNLEPCLLNLELKTPDPFCVPNIDSYPVVTRALVNYVAVLDAGLDAELVHNRFYIDSQATTLRFNYYTREVEKGEGNVDRKPNLDVLLRVNGQEHLLGRLSNELMAKQDPTGNPATDPTATFNIPTALRGQVGELIFRLSIPSTEPIHQSGTATVWLDNVTVQSAQPLATEVPAQAPLVQPVIGSLDSLESLTEAACSWWMGSVQLPDRIVGLSYGTVGTPTADFLGTATGSNGGHYDDLWDTGLGEGGLNDQLFLPDVGIIIEAASSLGVGLGAKMIADQAGVNNDLSLTSDGHSVQPQQGSSLMQGQETGNVIVESNPTDESNICQDIASIHERAIGITGFDNGADLSIPGGNGAISDVDVFQNQEIFLFPFDTLSMHTVQVNGGKFVDPLLNLSEQSTGWQRSKSQNEQQLFQHTSSFCTLTVPLDRRSVNGSGAFSAEGASGKGQVASGSDSSRLTVDDWRLTESGAYPGSGKRHTSFGMRPPSKASAAEGETSPQAATCPHAFHLEP